METSSSHIPTSKVIRSCSDGQISLKTSNAFLMKCKYIFLASFSFTCHYVDISTIKIKILLTIFPSNFCFFHKFWALHDLSQCKSSDLPELLRDRLPPELEREEGRRIPFLLSAVEGRDRSLGSGLFSIRLSSSGGIGVGDTAPVHKYTLVK